MIILFIIIIIIISLLSTIKLSFTNFIIATTNQILPFSDKIFYSGAFIHKHEKQNWIKELWKEMFTPPTRSYFWTKHQNFGNQKLFLMQAAIKV